MRYLFFFILISTNKDTVLGPNLAENSKLNFFLSLYTRKKKVFYPEKYVEK